MKDRKELDVDIETALGELDVIFKNITGRDYELARMWADVGVKGQKISRWRSLKQKLRVVFTRAD